LERKKQGGELRQGDSRVIRDADKSGAGKMNLNRKILLMLWHGRTAPQFKKIRNRTKRNHKTRVRRGRNPHWVKMIV